jgi:hypothetical protein
MQYQFAEPFIVDSSKIANALHVEATPIEQALGRLSRPIESQHKFLTDFACCPSQA